MWLLGFEPRSPRPQRGILTTKLQPQWCQVSHGFIFIFTYIRWLKKNAQIKESVAAGIRAQVSTATTWNSHH